MSCTFPEIPTDDVDDIINGTLELRYSLVAASVPGLNNLHLMSQFVIEFVDDPVINCFTEPVNYRAGSNVPIMITVSICICVHMYVCMHSMYTNYYIYICCSFCYRV